MRKFFYTILLRDISLRDALPNKQNTEIKQRSMNSTFLTTDASTSAVYQWAGALNLVNMLWVSSIVITLTALAKLFGIYVLVLLASMPMLILEMLAYISVAGLFAFADWLQPSLSCVFVALTACLCVPACYSFTLLVHFESRNARKELALQICCWLCTAVWSAAAIHFDSQVLGMTAVAALYAALGFFVVTVPLGYIVGFARDSAIPRCIGSSFYLICVYIYAALQGHGSDPYWRVFRPGVLGFGTFVYFLGWLVVSNRHYHSDPFGSDSRVALYCWTNVLALGSGGMAVLLGSVVPELHLLKSVGGTFFGLLLVEKYGEIPWQSEAWVWTMLGFGIMLWTLSFLANEHPDFVLSWDKL